jgi:hypothetical protein
MFTLTSEAMAEHIIHMCGAKKGSKDFVVEALENYANYRVGLMIEGVGLTEQMKQEWLRENEWSGI